MKADSCLPVPRGLLGHRTQGERTRSHSASSGAGGPMRRPLIHPNPFPHVCYDKCTQFTRRSWRGLVRDRSTSPPEDIVRGHGGSLGICRLQPMRELFSLPFLLRVSQKYFWSLFLYLCTFCLTTVLFSLKVFQFKSFGFLRFALETAP